MRVLRRFDRLLYLLALLGGLYVAAAGPLKSEDWPAAGAWDPWSALFIGLIVAGVYLALFTFYKQLETRASRAATGAADASLLCQQMAWRIGTECPHVTLSELAVSFWICKKRGRFARTIRFYLPGDRPPSGVQWAKGKGVAGWLWEHADKARAERLATRNAMSKRVFDQQLAQRRLGLTYDEWQLVSTYTAVYAQKEFAAGSAEPVGILVIDYSAPLTRGAAGVDQLDCIAHLVQNDHVVRQYRRAVVKRLTD